MEWLRWIFLAAGVLALAGIVWVYLRHKSEQAVELGSGRTEANLDDPIDVRIRAQDDARQEVAGLALDSDADDEGVIGQAKVKARIDPVITPATEPFEIEPEPLRWNQPTFTRTGAPEQIDVDDALGLTDADGVIGAVRRKVLDEMPEVSESLFRRRQTPHFSYQEKPSAPQDDGREPHFSETGDEAQNNERDDADPVVLPLLVASADGAPFPGERVENLIEEIGFEYGVLSIYHYPGELGETLFSLMNGVKPGTFDRGNSASFATPVLALFMQLPLNSSSESLILDQMIDIARDIADQLGGEVLDDQRLPLTSESIDRYREQLNS
jgi:cell division protein ZipA